MNTPLDQFTASYLRRYFFRHVIVDVNSLMESLLFTRRCIPMNIISLADVGKHPLAIRHFNYEVKNRSTKNLPLPKHSLNLFFPHARYYPHNNIVASRPLSSTVTTRRSFIIGRTMDEMTVGTGGAILTRENRTWQVTAVAGSLNGSSNEDDEDDERNGEEPEDDTAN